MRKNSKKAVMEKRGEKSKILEKKIMEKQKEIPNNENFQEHSYTNVRKEMFQASWE